MYRRYKQRLEEIQKIRMTKLKLVLFVGSAREGRLADRVLKFVRSTIEQDHELIVHDPTEMPFEMLKKPIFYYEDPSTLPTFLAKAQQEVAAADGFIFLSAEYHNSMPPALTNMVCHYPPGDLLHKPSAIISYSAGHFGGVRAAMQLRSFCAEAGCGSVPRIFPIPEAQNCLDENGVPAESMKERLKKNLKTTMDQLYWTASALKEYKKKHPPPPFSFP